MALRAELGNISPALRCLNGIVMQQGVIGLAYRHQGAELYFGICKPCRHSNFAPRIPRDRNRNRVGPSLFEAANASRKAFAAQ